jgi:hypothetical protein
MFGDDKPDLFLGKPFTSGQLLDAVASVSTT